MRTARRKKRPGRPRAARRRPVLAARVPEEFLTRIKASARKHGRNASAELMWLAELGLIENEFQEEMASKRERAFNEVNAILAAAAPRFPDETRLQEMLDLAVQRALERAGVKS